MHMAIAAQRSAQARHHVCTAVSRHDGSGRGTRGHRIFDIQKLIWIMRIVLFPFGGNAREAVATIEALNAAGGQIEICGFLDDNHTEITRSSLPMLGGRDAWPKKWKGHAKLLAAPGGPANYLSRAVLIESFDAGASDWAQIVDPTARIASSARIGLNTMIQAHCFIGVESRIGDHCVLLPSTVVSHDSSVGDHTMIGAHSSISGDVVIGRNCYIGASSSIHQGVRIGDGALVGIGANVIRDVPARAMVVGNPARLLRKRP